MSYERITKNCYNCSGMGYNNVIRTRFEYNYLEKRGQYNTYRQRQRCYKCKGSGEVIDQIAQKKRQKQRQKQRIEQQRRKKQQELKDKQKRFKQYVRQYQNQYQNQLNKPLLEDIEYIYDFNRNKNISPPTIKSEDELRIQFEKIQEDKKREKQRKQWQQEKQFQQRIKRAIKREQENKRKQKQQKDRQWQQFIKTPQGIKQMKKQQRLKKINYCVQKICCGPPSCKRVYQWSVILLTIGFFLYVFLVIY